MDSLLHALGGAAMAWVEMHFTGNVALAVFWPTLLGNVREQEQSRASRKRKEISTGVTIHPSDVRHWSLHRWIEWMAWLVGAGLVAGLYALR